MRAGSPSGSFRPWFMGPDPLEFIAAEAFMLYEQHARELGLSITGTPWPETRKAVRDCWRRTLAEMLERGTVQTNDWLG